MSDLIRTMRGRAGLTGAQLAERLGVTKGAVSQMEQSERLGTLQLSTLRRALEALGYTVSLAAEPADPYLAHRPERASDAMNEALQEGRPAFALRMMTQAAQTIRLYPAQFTADALNRRPSELADRRWEQLFRAYMGDAIEAATGHRPEWAQPQRLSRAWYPFGASARQRARAMSSTPPRLRELNILIDARSLSRA